MLDIRLLGEPLVLLDGSPLPLPPSKKTRALLAYLALTGRAHRREKLCGLLWDVTDDPRAALRWSLTKLRELVDAEGQTRLLANRETVQLELRAARVDVLEVKQLLRGTIEELPSETLEAALAPFRGELLEGLDLPEFHAYHAFCVAEREELRRLHKRALTSLLARERTRPERALPLARQLLDLDPLDDALRARFMELLHQSGRAREAEEEARTSRRLTASQPLAQPERGARESQVGAAPRAPAPLIGRGPELARMRAALSKARAGLSVVLLEAEAGVGKTRLLEAVRGELALVVEASACELSPGSPYAPWVRILQQALAHADDARLRALLAELADAPAELGSDGAVSLAREPARFDRARLFQGVADFFARQAATLTIVLDDVHWLDEGSCALLRHVLESHPTRPLGLLLAARPGELADNAAILRVLRGLRRQGVLEEIAIAPLSAQETQALLASVESRADPERVHRESAGNALFVLELARAPAPAERGVPLSIARVVRDRLAALSNEVADVLRWASVLGARFELAQLERLLLLDAETFVTALEQLERLGWLRCEPSHAAFSHQIVCSAIYDGLSGPRRALMHLKVARLYGESFENDGSRAAELARHAALGGDNAMAARACAVAGRRCLRLGARADAHALARMGLPYAEGLSEPARTTLSIELLDLSFVAHRPEAVATLVEHLSQLAGRALELGAVDHARRATFLRVMATWEDGHSADAERFVREVEQISRRGGPHEQVSGLGDAARCLFSLERDLPEAEALILEAESVARGSALELASVALARGALHLYRAEYDAADVAFTRAGELARRDGDKLAELHALEAGIETALERRDYGRTARLAAELLALGEKSRAGSEVPYARAALALGRAGVDPQRDLTELSEALAALDLADSKRRSAILEGSTAELARERGLWALAQRHAERTVQLAEAVQRPSDAALARSLLAELAALGPDREAERRSAQALAEAAARPISARARARARAVLERVKPSPQQAGAKSDGTRHRRTRLR